MSAKPGQMIPPDAYPQMVAKSEAAAVSRMLKSPDTVVRGSRVITPSPDDPLDPGDELLFVASPDQEPELQRMLGHL